MAIKTHEFTFESSGVRVFYRQVNPLVAIDVRASMEKDRPKPPIEKVKLAGVETEQPNEDDPDYIELLDMFEETLNQKINETYVRRSKLKFDYEGWEEEVSEYRNDIPNVKESDEWIFLTRVIATQPELLQFYQALADASGPTAEATQAARSSFPA